jgi:putative phosphoribosyl transferase
MSKTKTESGIVQDALILSGRVRLDGELIVPQNATGIVLFAHGSDGSRYNPHNLYVARALHKSKVGTLLFDLLTAEEGDEEQYTHHLRFDISLLARRLVDAILWVKAQEELQGLPIGFFGTGTGATAALVVAAELTDENAVMVLSSGRADLAGAALAKVRVPTLLIVGGHDKLVIKLNRDAYSQLQCEKQLKIIEGATHLFQEPGVLDETAKLASEWFISHFKRDEKFLT